MVRLLPSLSAGHHGCVPEALAPRCPAPIKGSVLPWGPGLPALILLGRGLAPRAANTSSLPPQVLSLMAALPWAHPSHLVGWATVHACSAHYSSQLFHLCHRPDHPAPPLAFIHGGQGGAGPGAKCQVGGEDQGFILEHAERTLIWAGVWVWGKAGFDPQAASPTKPSSVGGQTRAHQNSPTWDSPSSS